MMIVFKCGRLNLLDPSEPAQACNGIAFLVHGFRTQNDILKMTALETKSILCNSFICAAIEHNVGSVFRCSQGTLKYLIYFYFF
jgi:hypothetical protein